jgi:HSP20 family protein
MRDDIIGVVGTFAARRLAADTPRVSHDVREKAKKENSIMLTLYRPFSNLLRDEFFFGGRDLSPWGNAWRAAESFNPAVDVVENDGAYLVKAELPGIAPENIDVQVQDGVLTVRGERKYENEQERGGYRRVERSYGSFARSFVLPKGTKAEDTEAQVEHGVLTVTIPKAAASVARKVEVTGGGGLVEKAKKLFSKPTEAPSPAPQA